jgi:hypothetical protein
MAESAEQPEAGEAGAAAAGETGTPEASDPVQLLVKAVGMLPPEERDELYAWLLRRAAGLRWRIPQLALQEQSTELRTLLQQVPRPGGRRGAQSVAQQVVPVRFSAEQHAQLREWCAEHGFSMATVIRGLVARFLEGRLPERN